MKQRRQGPSPLALVIALVVMLVPLSPAMAGGGSGHAGGGAVGHGAFWQGWAYRDDDSGGFGGYTVASIDKAFGVMRIRDGANGTTARVKREANLFISLSLFQ